MANTQSLNVVVSTLEGWFSKAPSLPKGAKDFIVTITPWMALIAGVLLIIVGILGLVGGTVLTPLAAMEGETGAAGILLISSVITLVLGVFYLISFKPLKDRQLKGWRFLFWAEALYIVGSLISMDILSVVFGFIIGFYILFQIKSYYK